MSSPVLTPEEARQELKELGIIYRALVERGRQCDPEASGLNRVDGMYARLCRLSDPDKAGAGCDLYEIEHHLDLGTSEALALYVSMQVMLPLSHRTPEVWARTRVRIAQIDAYPDTETALRLWLDAVCATTRPTETE